MGNVILFSVRGFELKHHSDFLHHSGEMNHGPNSGETELLTPIWLFKWSKTVCYAPRVRQTNDMGGFIL